MLKLKTEVTLPDVTMSGFESPLSPEEAAIQDAVHRFARDVMRPTGAKLDKMSAAEVAAPGSPYYEVFAEAAKMGFDVSMTDALPPEMAVRIESLIGEELGWGDAGLAVSLGAASLPMKVANALGDKELMEMSAGKIGCWIGTQPDRGSDVLMLDPAMELTKDTPANRGNIRSRIEGEEIVISGQSSAWVSNGAVAQMAVACIGADYGNGAYDAQGRPHGMTVLIPLDLPGVSRGKPLEKIGQRSLPQGEIYFDNVRVPKRFGVAMQDAFYGNFASTWSYAGTHMSQVFTGVARAAFEMALQYCHERRQGGQLLIEHQLTRYRLGDMLRRLEAARAAARRALAYARLSPRSHPYATASAKVTVTEEAMKIVSEAFRLFGGAGTSLEYPIEKLLRDTKSALIEDGESWVLTMRLGVLCQQLYANGWANA